MDDPLETRQAVARLAPAKVNLALHVTGQRPDGYHLLETLVVFAHTGDRLMVTAAIEDSLSFSGPFGETLAEDTAGNLVARAREALRAATSLPCPPVAIHLEKNLPIASGIGGGSADAAATLHALDEFWGLDFSDAELAAIGIALGADVPMCLKGAPLIARGVGEEISAIRDLPPFCLVLVNPGVEVPTPAIFKALSVKDNPPLPPLPDQMTDAAVLAGWLQATRNDLEPPARALQPVTGEALAALEASGALIARMSGSGATCFGLFADDADANNARARIAASHPDWWVG